MKAIACCNVSPDSEDDQGPHHEHHRHQGREFRLQAPGPQARFLIGADVRAKAAVFAGFQGERANDRQGVHVFCRDVGNLSRRLGFLPRGGFNPARIAGHDQQEQRSNGKREPCIFFADDEHGEGNAHQGQNACPMVIKNWVERSPGTGSSR